MIFCDKQPISFLIKQLLMYLDSSWDVGGGNHLGRKKQQILQMAENFY